MDEFRVGSNIISSNNPLKNDITLSQRVLPISNSDSSSINPLMRRIVNENLNSNWERAVGRNERDNPVIRRQLENALRTEIFPKIVDAIIRFLQSKVNQMKTIIRENMDKIVGYVGFLGFISDIGQTILDGIERFFNSVFSRYKGEMMSKFLSKLGMIVSAILTSRDILEDEKITVGELVIATLNIGMGYVGSSLGSMIGSKAGLFIGALLGGIGAPIGGAVGYILGGIIGGYLGGEFGAWLGSRISEHFGLENRVIVDFSTAAATS